MLEGHNWIPAISAKPTKMPLAPDPVSIAPTASSLIPTHSYFLFYLLMYLKGRCFKEFVLVLFENGKQKSC